jgi:hypothetical protein
MRAGMLGFAALAALASGAAAANPDLQQQSGPGPGTLGSPLSATGDAIAPAQSAQPPMVLAQAPQNMVQIQNRWKPAQYLNIEHGRLVASGIEPGWFSAMWTIEPVPGQPFVRIRNHWKPDRLLNIEHGSLQAGPIEEGWFSAMWTIERAEAGSFRIRNRWKDAQYLHIQNGYITSGPIDRGWWSAMWFLPRL